MFRVRVRVRVRVSVRVSVSVRVRVRVRVREGAHPLGTGTPLAKTGRCSPGSG